MKKNFLGFTVAVAIVIFGVAVIDVCVGATCRKVVHKLNEKNYAGQVALLNYNLNAVTADIVIIGSSTATCHYNPQIFSDSISKHLGSKYTAFNAGAYTQEPNYSYCEMESLITRKAPKIAIVDIQPQQLGGLADESALKPLRSYYDINPYVKEILDEHESRNNLMLMHFNMFKFNTEFLKLIMSFSRPIGANGFDPHTETVDSFTIVPKKDTATLNLLMVADFEKMINVAQSHNVKLFVCMSPRLFYTDKESASYKKIIELCAKHNVPLFDFTTDPELVDGKYFKDKTHLNINGANLLSRKTCMKVIENMQN